MDWSHLWNNCACRLKRGDYWDSNHDKMELRSIWDDVVSGLRRTLCDVSSVTEAPAIEPVPRRCSLPTQTVDRLVERKKIKNKKETPKFMSNLQCGDRRSDGDFLRACTFIIQSDIHSIPYGSWRFCLIFMTDTKSRSNITNSGSKSISSSNEVQLQHCKSYLCFTWVFTFYAIYNFYYSAFIMQL